MASQSIQTRSSFFDSARGRTLLENLTAYLFLAPAGAIIFIFGIFPVAFAFFVSLHRWRRFPEEYRGLDEYVDALGNFAFVAFFWLAIGLAVYGLYTFYKMFQESKGERRAFTLFIPGIALTGTLLAFVNWFFILLPIVLDVPVRLRGQELSRSIFVDEFFASFRFPGPLAAAETMWILFAVALVLTTIFYFVIRLEKRWHYLLLTVIISTALASGFLLMQLTLDEIQIAIDEAVEDGESLPIWTYTILISTGVALLFAAYAVWQRVVKADDDRRFVLMGLAAILLVIGAVLLIIELPQAFSEADDDVFQAFGVTVMYAAFSVPLQLTLGLTLAVLLYQNIRWKSFFRVVYFLPYITPFVATSVIFSLLFSHRSGSPANQLLASLGIETQTWLLEPTGIFQIIFGEGIPDILAGPGLALFVIILYNVWIYAGYSTVIFLAGLGNIPKELYEAARIDGASSWSSFRFITLPLLSPTTFFLMLIATIGTFQAFTQIFLMRRPGAYDAVDTINILIYEEIRDSNPDYAYGSAMAFVLFAVILALTIFQNRFVGRRVFYG